MIPVEPLAKALFNSARGSDLNWEMLTGREQEVWRKRAGVVARDIYEYLSDNQRAREVDAGSCIDFDPAEQAPERERLRELVVEAGRTIDELYRKTGVVQGNELDWSEVERVKDACLALSEHSTGEPERRFTAATPDDLDFATEKDRERAWNARGGRPAPAGQPEETER